jgi:hypothetical protein
MARDKTNFSYTEYDIQLQLGTRRLQSCYINIFTAYNILVQSNLFKRDVKITAEQFGLQQNLSEPS